MKHSREEGISSVGILAAVVIVVTLGLGGLSIWSYLNYHDQKYNTDQKIAAAVGKAETAQADKDRAQFLEDEKKPNTQFTGPTDYGSVSFLFPKTWSVYVGDGDDGSNGTFTAYLNPKRVPTVSQTQQFALHVTIESRPYETVLGTYSALVKKGSLTSSVVTTNGLSGTRLDGNFSKTIEGSAVIFKVRDKTLTVQTDSPTFRGDFNDTVLPSLTFTP